jgi:hypothetical protein
MWTDPSGHVYATGEVLSASSLNTYVKDNLIDLDRRTTVTGATVATTETTTSTSYAALATAGPAVTVTIGSAGLAIVELYCFLTNTASTNPPLMAYAVSGATTVAASDSVAIASTPPVAAAGFRIGASYYISGLTAGSNTFTAKYKIFTSGTAQFADRKATVTPLGS